MLRIEYQYKGEVLNDNLEVIADKGPRVTFHYDDGIDDWNIYDLFDKTIKPLLLIMGYSEVMIDKLQAPLMED